MKNQFNILIITPNWLGDQIMAQSLYIALKKRHTSCQIDVVTSEKFKGLYQRMPEINNILIFENKHNKLDLKKRWLFSKKIRKKSYSLAIILPLSLKATLIPFFAGIKKRRAWSNQRYGLINESQPLDQKKHTHSALKQVEQYLALQKFPFEIKKKFIPKLKESKDKQETILKKFKINTQQKILICCPGSAYGPSKQWPLHHLKDLCVHYLEKNWEIILLGTEKEKEICQNIKKNCPKVKNLCMKTKLEDVIDLMSTATWIISNDSGLMHLAAATQQKQIAIFGSSSPLFTPPLNKNAHIIFQNLNCSPCFKRVCPLKHNECLETISSEQVIKKIHENSYH